MRQVMIEGRAPLVVLSGYPDGLDEDLVAHRGQGDALVADLERKLGLL